LARDTDRIELLSLVSPITFRHPAVLAKTMTTIDSISGGRFALGVGAGWHAAEHAYYGIDLPPVSERFDRLADALGYLWAYLGHPERGYTGRYWTLAPFT